MTVFGIGPVLAPVGLVVVAGTIVLHLLFRPLFTITGADPDLLLSIGIGLGALGTYVLALSGTRIVKAARRQELVTNGPFAVFLNPIYGAFVLFIIPAVALALQSWLVLLSSPVVYVMYRLLVRREEHYLMSRFGDAYLAHRKRVLLKFL